jgi:hypothetical protein
MIRLSNRSERSGGGSFYRLFVPKQAVGASLVYFDLFNATGSNRELLVHSVKPIVSGAVAVTGVVSVDLHLTRTTTVGTGGTAATNGGTAIDAATFTVLDPSTPVVPATVTARLTPGGGAAAGALLGYTNLFSEETNAGTYLEKQLVPENRAIVVPQNSGLRVVQGVVASVGNVGFEVLFELV